MDDIAESQDLSKEISEAISNPVAFGNDVDEVSPTYFLLIGGRDKILIFLKINLTFSFRELSKRFFSYILSV